MLKKLGESSYQINIGILTIAAHASEIQVATKTVKTTESRQMQSIIVDRKSFSDTYKRTLDLRGCKVTEALSQLDKNIDLALLQRVKSFSVLHGKGEGVLSKVVHEHLEQHSAVQHKHFAHPEEGGHGLTRVYLEKDA